MDKVLMTQIIGVSLIFVVVVIVALANILRINYHLNKNDKEKELDKTKATKLYDVNKRKKS